MIRCRENNGEDADIFLSRGVAREKRSSHQNFLCISFNHVNPSSETARFYGAFTVELPISVLSLVVVIDLTEDDKSDERERGRETFHQHRTHKLLLFREEMNIINSNQDLPRNLYHSSCDVLNPRSSISRKSWRKIPTGCSIKVKKNWLKLFHRAFVCEKVQSRSYIELKQPWRSKSNWISRIVIRTNQFDDKSLLIII